MMRKRLSAGKKFLVSQETTFRTENPIKKKKKFEAIAIPPRIDKIRDLRELRKRAIKYKNR